MPLTLATIFVVLSVISISVQCVCNHSALDCIRRVKSLSEWKTIGYGIKHTDTVNGREYGYCMHGVPEFADIETNAILKTVSLWYSFDFGHAAIEMIFKYRKQFICVITEGLQDKYRNQYSLVSCHQFLRDTLDLKNGYLRKRSSLYDILLQSNMSDESITYRAVFNGPLKRINDLYVNNPWTVSLIIGGRIDLGHGCLWYAVHLYAQLHHIGFDEVLANISKPIIRFKKARGIE